MFVYNRGMNLLSLVSVVLLSGYPQPASPEARALMRQGEMQLQQGDAKGALQTLQKAWDTGQHSDETAYAAACAAARLGDKDGAFSWLNRSLDAGLIDTKLLREDQDLNTLRSDPRFAGVLSHAEKNLGGLGDPALRQELLARREEDQAARRALMAAGPQGSPEASARLKAVDAKNTAWMKSVVKKKGWPGASTVGVDGADAAFLLVQHADQDPAFQAEVLKALEKALAKHDVSGQHVAYLTDRVRASQHQPQVYGTQFHMVDGKLVPQPIEDQAHVDERRKAVGLPTMAEYEAMMHRTYAHAMGEDAKKPDAGM